MDNFIIQHLAYQLILTLPLIVSIVFWKRTGYVFKFIVLCSFFLTLPNLRDTIFHMPVSYPVDVTQNLEGKEFDFQFYPGVAEDTFIAGFDIQTIDQSASSILFSKNQWPTDSDVSISIDHNETNNDNKRYSEFKKYNIFDSNFKYGRFVDFEKSFTKTTISYKFLTNPPENIRSIRLALDLVYFNDVGIGFFLGNVINGVIVYGTLILYYLLFLLYKYVVKRIKNNQS